MVRFWPVSDYPVCAWHVRSGRIADVTGPPDWAVNRPGGCRLAALHQVGNYLRYKGRDASSFGKAARDPLQTLPQLETMFAVNSR